MITIKEVTYKNYGKCLSMTNDKMELLVTIGVGPRIIKCNLRGSENLMFEDLDRKQQEDVSSLYGEGKKWYIYGGHRLWLSPEDYPRTYYPDNASVVYSTHSTGAVFTPKVQEVTGLAYEIAIDMDETEPVIRITHSITNTQKKPVTGSAWALSVLAPGGAVLVPLPREDTGLLPSRVVSLWPYVDMTDDRYYWGKDYVMLRQDPNNVNKTKFGVNNTVGKVAYLNHGQALVKCYKPAHPDGTYTDFGVSTEVFTNALFIEMETLSPVSTIGKGEKITHTETWMLYDEVKIPEKNTESVAKAAKNIGLE